MKYEIQKREFKPISIQITLETQKEIDSFYEVIGKLDANIGYDLYKSLEQFISHDKIPQD